MEPKIHLEVWAGSLGVPVLRKALDAAKLNANDRAELQQLISDSGVLNMLEHPAPPEKLRDANQTKMVFDVAGKTQTVRVSEESASPKLRQLIEFVKTNAS
jgi:hypothetical protein